MLFETFISDPHRDNHLKVLNKRIIQGKSTLLIGKSGVGKTELIKQINSTGKIVIQVDSLGTTHHILCSVLKKCNFNFSAKTNKNIQYLKAVCQLKDILLIIDDASDLKPMFFRFIKRIMDANIPIIMISRPEILPILKQENDDVFARLRILQLPPLTSVQIKNNTDIFEKEALEVVSGFSLGNLFLLKDIWEEGLEKLKSANLSKITISLVQKIIQNRQQYFL
jgi:energy-coupling factor transporter ATP-binding protein EcfA2